MDLASIGFKADTSGLMKAQKGLDDLSKQGGKTERALGGASSSIGKAFAGIAVAAGGLVSATSALQKLVSVSREFDVLNAGLITATGSAQKASHAFKAIQDFATSTPYSLAQATKGFTQLVNLGLTPSEKALTSYGNTAAAMGKDLSQMIEAVADATVGEFERLKEFGIKAKTEGDNVSFTFRGMTTTVKKSADEIEGYLIGLGQNEFASAMANRMQTLDGAISNLSDSWDGLFRTISSQGAGNIITDSVRKATSAIEELDEAIVSGKLSERLDAISNAALGAASVLGVAWVSGAASAAAATYQKVAADMAAISASNAATVADKARQLSLAKTAMQEALAAKGKQAAAVFAAKAALEQITAEQALEAVRMRAQISETGRIMTATRMAELGVARAALNKQLTASQIALNAAEAQAVAASSALTAATGGLAAAQSAATATSRALGAAVAFMTGPWGILLTTIGVAAAAFYATSESQSEVSYTSKNLKGEIDALTGSIKEMSAAQKESLSIKVSERLVQLNEEAQALKNVIQLRKGIAGFDKAQIEEFSKLIGVTGVNAETLNAAATHSQAALDSLEQETEKLNKTMLELDGKAGAVTDRLEQYKVATDKAAKSSGEFSKKLKDIEEEMEQYTEAAIWVSENESRMFDSEIVAEMEGELGKLNKKVDEYASISEKAAERIEEAFADAWLNAFDGFESVVDGMKNAFKRMLAEMAHMALTRPILVSMGLGGLLPGGAAASTLTGGLVGSGVGLAGAIGGGIVGLGGMLGGAFGGGLASTGALLGTGSMAGLSGAFANVGAWASSGSIAGTIGAAMPLIAGAVVAAMGINKLAGGGLFGTSYKVDNQTLALALSGGDVTGSIRTDQSKKKSLFRGTSRRSSTSAFDTSTIESAFAEITAALADSANAFGIVGAEEIIKGFKASASINIKGKSEAEIQAAIQEWIGNTSSALVNAVFGDSLDGLRKEGEGAIDTVNRLTMNMNAVKSITETLGLGFDLTGKAAMLASTNIVELAGGLDQLAALSSQYYSAFYSEAEKQQLMATQLADAFAEINLSMPMTREGFRALVDGLDLTTEAGQEMFAALMQLVPGMDQYLSALEAQKTASEQAAEAAKKEAEAKAAALKAQGLDLQLRLYDALGQSAETLALRRRMELDATDETLRALLLQIYAAEDAATAQRELASAQAEAAETARKAADAAKNSAQDAFGRLQDAVEMEKDRLQAELDAKLDTMQLERDALEKHRDAVVSGYEDAGRAARDYTNTLQGLSDVIYGFLDDAGSSINPFKRLSQIFSEVKAGMLPSQGELSSVISAIRSAGSEGFESSTDQARAMAIALNQAAGIGKVVGGMLSESRSTESMIEHQIADANKYYDDSLAKIDAAAELAQKLHNEQVSALDAQLAEAQKQLNALMGIDDRILSVSDALAEFYDAVANAYSLQALADNAALAAINNSANAQVEAINLVEDAILQIGSELVEINKPDDRIWLPVEPMPITRIESSEADQKKVIALLEEIAQAQKSNADHSSKTAAYIQQIALDGVEVIQ